MKPIFVFDTHMDSKVYSLFLAHSIQRRAVLKGAKLLFIGDCTFGYPTVERTNNPKDKVYGLLVQFYKKEEFEHFESVIIHTRSNWKCSKKKVVVRDDQGNDVDGYIYILRPYTKDRGTRHGRLEVPLKECFELMLRAYKAKNFPVKYLYKALTEAIKDYYEIDNLAN